MDEEEGGEVRWRPGVPLPTQGPVVGGWASQRDSAQFERRDRGVENKNPIDQTVNGEAKEKKKGDYPYSCVGVQVSQEKEGR